MSSLIERWDSSRGGVEASEVARRLVAGDDPEKLADSIVLAPPDLIAALAWLGLEGDGPSLVQERPARPELGEAIERVVGGLFASATRPARLALLAGLHQLHDFWDASHQAAQEADDLGERRFSAYWHGIAHRREPDPGNASYWFRRVGRHPIFPELAESAAPIVESAGSPVRLARVVRGGDWDPFAFNDACTAARAGSADERLARRLQRLEMDHLLAATLEGMKK